MEISLQEQFDNLLKNKTDSLEVFANQLAEILDKTSTKDTFLLSKIGVEIRNVDKVNENFIYSNKYIDHLMELGIENFTSNKFIMSPFTWCVYQVKIKPYEYNENTYSNFIEWANLVINNCSQQPLEKTYATPFVVTVLKVIKIFREKSAISYYQLLDWVNKLNPKELSEEPYSFTDFKGKEREIASPKEVYYQTKTKCLEKLKKYEECSNCCEFALNDFKKWHYRNDLWITARMWYCRCMTSLSDDSINKYKAIAEKENFWYMYHKIGNIYLSAGDTDNALYYFNKALVSDTIDSEKMINLFFDLGLIWENNKRYDIAKMFYQACYYYRLQNLWTISEELKFAQLEYDFDINSSPSLKILQKFSVDFIVKHDKLLQGRITKIDFDKKFGFISYGNKSIHFSLKVTRIRLKLKDQVFFNIKMLENGRTTAKSIIKMED